MHWRECSCKDGRQGLPDGMTSAFQNGLVKNGYKTGHSHRTYLKLAIFFIFLTFISALYMLGDFTSIEYIELVKWAEDIDRRTTFFNYINTSYEEKREGYLVWSPSCRIPDINPWHDSIKAFIKKETMPVCGKALSDVRRQGSDHILTVDDNGMQCCYSLIIRHDLPFTASYREKPDNVYTIGKCINFTKNVTFSGTEQFIKVNCTSKQSENKEYTGMHAFVRNIQSVANKSKPDDNQKDKLSVMFIGIDSISRLNLFRTMPLTVNYLNKKGWLNFKGYNKMGENTFPNLIAILSGYTVSQLRSSCWGSNEKKLDDCPIIWKEFSKQGYITAYVEDEPTIGTFNYLKTGFVSSPTDYYLRPFLLAAQKFMKVKIKAGTKVCLGTKSTSDYILDYLIDFAITFRDALTFSFFWMNNFSHNDVNTPSGMDERFHSFFSDLENTGAFNNTLIIFLSDHGMRYGKVRETYVGWIEERLPFIYFWIPDKFKELYPQKYHSLKKNADRLTSPYDLHLTLKELLHLPVNGTLGCPSCQSLFEDVTWNRTCTNAGITDHWCTCGEYKILSIESGPVRAIARFVLQHLNSLLINGTSYLVNGTKCATLKVNRILSVKNKVSSRQLGQDEYVILFETLPGEALFEATVKHKNSFTLMDTVSRINAYGGQSKCMTDFFLQKYCFCQNEYLNVLKNV